MYLNRAMARTIQKMDAAQRHDGVSEMLFSLKNTTNNVSFQFECHSKVLSCSNLALRKYRQRWCLITNYLPCQFHSPERPTRLPGKKYKIIRIRAIP